VLPLALPDVSPASERLVLLLSSALCLCSSLEDALSSADPDADALWKSRLLSLSEALPLMLSEALL
jgi:hypothetical protein